LETQHIPADGGVEGLVEGHRRQLALVESHIGERHGLRAGPSCGQGGVGSIDSHDLPRRPDQVGRKERDVSGTRADVENAHAMRESSLDQELSGDGIDQLGLSAKSLKFSIRVTHDVRTCAVIPSLHKALPSNERPWRANLLSGIRPMGACPDRYPARSQRFRQGEVVAVIARGIWPDSGWHLR
jgi:hypothetical protein